MEKEAYRQLFGLEETFWWFLGRREAIRNLLASVTNGKEKSRRLSILDVGCGTGGMLNFFKTFGDVWGIDFSREALAYCRKRNQTGRLIQGSILSLPFPEGQFDLVTALDLLYHRTIEDDLIALKELCRVCKKEGHLLITDSAFEFLRGPHDRIFHGVRRYTTKELKFKVEEGGFLIERISYLNMILFPLICLWRKFRRSSTGSDLKAIPSPLNRWLTWLFCGEARLLKHWDLPFGTSVICLARKSS